MAQSLAGEGGWGFGGAELFKGALGTIHIPVSVPEVQAAGASNDGVTPADSQNTARQPTHTA